MNLELCRILTGCLLLFILTRPEDVYLLLFPDLLVFTSPNNECSTHFLKILPGLSHVGSSKRHCYNIFIFYFKKQNIVIAEYYFFYFLLKFLQFLANTISWIILAIFLLFSVDEFCYMVFIYFPKVYNRQIRGIVHLEEFLL